MDSLMKMKYLEWIKKTGTGKNFVYLHHGNYEHLLEC